MDIHRGMSRKRSSLSPHDVATLPPTLRRRLGLGKNPPPLTTPPLGSTTTTTPSRDDSVDVTTFDPAIHRAINCNNSNHNNNNYPTKSSTSTSLSSCRELRRLIHESYSALTVIQRQLYRGEAHYFEESCSHRGNVFQGWDNIWIESGGISDGSSANNNLQSTGGMGGVDSVNHPDTTTTSSSSSVKQRKSMPPDYRWFSSSCGLKLPIFVGDGSVPALDRPSLSIVGGEDDDDDEPHQPHLNPSTSVERMVANEKGKLEVVNDDDDGESWRGINRRSEM